MFCEGGRAWLSRFGKGSLDCGQASEMYNGLAMGLRKTIPNGVGNGPRFGYGILERVPGCGKK